MMSYFEYNRMRSFVSLILSSVCIVLFSCAALSDYDSRASVLEQKEKSPQQNIVLRYYGCSNEQSLLVLENQTDHPIYARMDRPSNMRKYKDIDLPLVDYSIEYKSPEAQAFTDVTPMNHVIYGFETVKPHESIIFEVYLWEKQGEYKITVAYIDDYKDVQLLNHAIEAILIKKEDMEKYKEDFAHIKAAWKVVSSDAVVSKCHS